LAVPFRLALRSLTRLAPIHVAKKLLNQNYLNREELMKGMKFALVASLILVLIPASGTPRRMHAQDDKGPYPRMAPLEQYLMPDRDAEIALARSAAPESISRDATVVVLGRHGYETAVEGKNGFVCGVDRSWMQLFDQAGFWNPKIRGAVCFNPPAARSVLPVLDLRARLVLAGLSKAEMIARIRAAYAKKELPLLEPGSMAYMMSKGSYLTDDGSHNMAHLMFYTPLMDSANWGADLPKSPVYLLPVFQGAPEPIDVFIVPTRQWSDGTPQM
jgi:hypothetical protein